MKSNFIVSADWLATNLGMKKLVLLDASMKPVTQIADQKSEGLIPNSIKFDLKEFSDETSSYSHTLLSRGTSITKIRDLGINDDSFIVIYDNVGAYSSPRVWYMLKDFGHKDVYVLDGGLPSWCQAGYPIVEGWLLPSEKGNFSDRAVPLLFCDSQEVLSYLNDDKVSIVDARSAGRFHGIEAEPRANLKAGHIPNSTNLPFENVLSNGKFKSKEQLEAIFSSLKLDNELLIFSCGSGITSCIVALAAQMIGHKNVRIYDGSWTEWGDVNNSFPIETT